MFGLQPSPESGAAAVAPTRASSGSRGCCFLLRSACLMASVRLSASRLATALRSSSPRITSHGSASSAETAPSWLMMSRLKNAGLRSAVKRPWGERSLTECAARIMPSMSPTMPMSPTRTRRSTATLAGYERFKARQMPNRPKHKGETGADLAATLPSERWRTYGPNTNGQNVSVRSLLDAGSCGSSAVGSSAVGR
jgi:hypothetical protein